MSLRLIVLVDHLRCLSVLELSGDLDLSVRHPLRELVDQASGPAVDDVVVDLSGLGFTDATGVNALVSLAAKAKSRGARVVLAASPPLLERLLRLLDLYDTFDHAPTLAAALSLTTLPGPTLPGPRPVGPGPTGVVACAGRADPEPTP